MDLRLLLRVLWRFRLLVAAGFFVASTLAFFSIVRVDPGGSPSFSYRSSATWASSAKLFVTEPGFPWGRRLIELADEGDSAGSAQSDPGRFTGLAVLYARFADSDGVLRILLRDGKFKGKISASPLLTGGFEGDPLPIIEVSATGTSMGAAITNTRRASNALVEFIRQQQELNAIPTDDRVVIQIIETPRKAKLLAGRPKVVPIFVFVFVMGLVIGLAFLLENLRPLASPAEIRADPAARLRRPA